MQSSFPAHANSLNEAVALIWFEMKKAARSWSFEPPSVWNSMHRHNGLVSPAALDNKESQTHTEH
jgi:hypothetical protein